MLRVLVGSACVVVIGFGAQNLYGQHKAHVASVAVANYRAGCETTLSDLTAYVQTKSSYDDAAVAMATRVKVCVNVLRGTDYPSTVPYSFVEYPGIGSDKYAASY